MKGLRGALSSALDNISRLEVGPVVSCSKTRSVDEILDTTRRRRTGCTSQFHSADQISLASKSGHLTNVSSISTVPLPDISGRW